MQKNTTNQADTLKVWDLPVRLFHWALVSLVIGAVVTANLPIAYMEWHMRIGYAILTLLIFRVLWGIIGPYYARFQNFIYSPKTVLKYAQSLFLKHKDRHYLGHNPMGALMVFLMLLLLVIQAISGLFSSDDIFTDGPLVRKVSSDLSDFFTGIHHTNIILLIIAIIMHICANLAYWLFKKENLIAPMIHGRKEKKGAEDWVPQTQDKPVWLALICFTISALIVFYIVEIY
ncbi:MAG: cytochrome b/b6 domain-containing protein [Gammaproteobacteria bacterium]|nr:cytochrome b/b6 domain-containing protein [Gammaproteobacteria bacterium]